MAWTGFMKASKEMAEQGTFTEFANVSPAASSTRCSVSVNPQIQNVRRTSALVLTYPIPLATRATLA
jgi:hypothetical protein